VDDATFSMTREQASSRGRALCRVSGQALSYKIGELKSANCGAAPKDWGQNSTCGLPRPDSQGGSMPLSVLEQGVIEDRGQRRGSNVLG